MLLFLVSSVYWSNTWLSLSSSVWMGPTQSAPDICPASSLCPGSWLDFIARNELRDRGTPLNTVCQFTKQHGVKLDTLVKHSSPQLESMLFSGYTSSYNCIHSECWLMQVLCSKYLYVRSMWGILSPAGSHVRINRHYLGLALCEDEWSLSHSAHCTPHHCGITPVVCVPLLSFPLHLHCSKRCIQHTVSAVSPPYTAMHGIMQQLKTTHKQHIVKVTTSITENHWNCKSYIFIQNHLNNNLSIAPFRANICFVPLTLLFPFFQPQSLTPVVSCRLPLHVLYVPILYISPASPWYKPLPVEQEGTHASTVQNHCMIYI